MKESPLIKEARKKAMETYISENAHRKKSKIVYRIGGYSLYGLKMDCRKEKCYYCKIIVFIDNKLNIPNVTYKYICPACSLKKLKLSAFERENLNRVQKFWDKYKENGN